MLLGEAPRGGIVLQTRPECKCFVAEQWPMNGIDRPSNGRYSNLWCLNHTTEMTVHIAGSEGVSHNEFTFCRWIRDVYVVLYETVDSIVFMHPKHWICKYVRRSSRICRLLLLTPRHVVWQGTNNWNRDLTFVAHIERNRLKSEEITFVLIVRYWNFGMTLCSMRMPIRVLRARLPSDHRLVDVFQQHTCLLQH